MVSAKRKPRSASRWRQWPTLPARFLYRSIFASWIVVITSSPRSTSAKSATGRKVFTPRPTTRRDEQRRASGGDEARWDSLNRAKGYSDTGRGLSPIRRTSGEEFVTESSSGPQSTGRIFIGFSSLVNRDIDIPYGSNAATLAHCSTASRQSAGPCLQIAARGTLKLSIQ